MNFDNIIVELKAATEELAAENARAEIKARLRKMEEEQAERKRIHEQHREARAASRKRQDATLKAYLNAVSETVVYLKTIQTYYV